MIIRDGNYRIRPEDIDVTKGHFWNAFDHMETEISAKWLVRFARERGMGWGPFTYPDIHGFYAEKFDRDKSFRFNRLVEAETVREFGGRMTGPHGGGWIVKEGDLYFFTSDFIDRCYRAAPVGEAKTA